MTTWSISDNPVVNVLGNNALSAIPSVLEQLSANNPQRFTLVTTFQVFHTGNQVLIVDSLNLAIPPRSLFLRLGDLPWLSGIAPLSVAMNAAGIITCARDFGRAIPQLADLVRHHDWGDTVLNTVYQITPNVAGVSSSV